MRYPLAVEDMEPGHWVVWVLDLPGCFSSAPTQSEAVARAPERIAAYFKWLSAHDPTLLAVRGPFEAEVAETFRSFASADYPEYVVNAFFVDDGRPLGYWDVVLALRLLEWTRQDLLRVVQPVPAEQLVAPVPGEVRGSIAGILKHIAGAENWYCSKLDVAVDDARLSEDPFEMLATVRANSRKQLVRLIGDDQVSNHYDELWSARKVLRRTLWHERDHTQHIAALLDLKGLPDL